MLISDGTEDDMVFRIYLNISHGMFINILLTEFLLIVCGIILFQVQFEKYCFIGEKKP